MSAPDKTDWQPSIPSILLLPIPTSKFINRCGISTLVENAPIFASDEFDFDMVISRSSHKLAKEDMDKCFWRKRRTHARSAL